MRFRRWITCCAITVSFMSLALPNAVAAGGESHNATPKDDCVEGDDAIDNSRDAAHDAGERDRDHEYDGYSEHGRSKRHRRGPVHVRRHYRHGYGHHDDCEIEPPVEVAEAPLALLLPASGVLTGGAAVLLVRRRSKNARIKVTEVLAPPSSTFDADSDGEMNDT